MPKKLTEAIDSVGRALIATGNEYSVKHVEEEVRRMWDDGEITNDPVAEAIHAKVKQWDKAVREQPGDQLDFGDWSFPASLVIGEGNRQPAHTARLVHVLADQAVKQTNKIRQDRAHLRYNEGVIAALPYLQQGMTLSEASAAWKTDHREPPVL